MLGLTPRIVATLKNYMRDPTKPVVGTTQLNEIGIDRLDLPMIFLDIEDALGVQVDYHDDGKNLTTVRDLVADVVTSLQARAMQPRPRAPRRKRNWMSTGV